MELVLTAGISTLFICHLSASIIATNILEPVLDWRFVKRSPKSTLAIFGLKACQNKEVSFISALKER
jgi:hypothetical protein